MIPSSALYLRLCETAPGQDGRPLATPETLAAWDSTLIALWSDRLSEATDASALLFAPETPTEEAYPEKEDYLATRLWKILLRRVSVLPETPEERYIATLTALWLLLKAVQAAPRVEFVEDYITVALRPVRRLRAGALTPLLCALLYDYHRGLWTPHLLKPQLWKLQVALAQTIAALPPNRMDAFWECLQCDDMMMCDAMLLGLEFLRSAHAVPQLLFGLENSQDHRVRAAIVDCLEQIADPHALPVMIRLRRDTATSDWTLSRHLHRAIRVIERQSREQSYHQLLRPLSAYAEEETSLLRSAPQGASDAENALLVRPIEARDESDQKERREA